MKHGIRHYPIVKSELNVIGIQPDNASEKQGAGALTSPVRLG